MHKYQSFSEDLKLAKWVDIELILVIVVTVKSQVLYLLLASATFYELNQCKFLLTKNGIKAKVLGKVLL